MVIAGGVIPDHDHQFLFNAGISFVFGPGTVLADAAVDILSQLIDDVRE